MSKLILCSGARTDRPYGFASTGVRVYSMEELCYYLFHHVYLIEEDMFSDALIDWIGTELKLTERADKLRLLKKQRVDLKTITTVVLCSTDYYTEADIKSFLKILDEVIGMPKIKRNCIKASNCLKNNQYSEAVAEYDNVLNSKEVIDLSPEEYGDLLHNLAVAKVHTVGLREASELFCQAYERNHREDSLRQYLFSLQISGNETQFKNKLEEYQVSEELHQNIVNNLEQKKEAALYSERMKNLQQLKQRKAQGRMSEYYQLMDEIIDSWKDNIRQI